MTEAAQTRAPTRVTHVSTYVRTYIRTCVRTYVHARLGATGTPGKVCTYVRTYVLSHVRTYVRAVEAESVRAYVRGRPGATDTTSTTERRRPGTFTRAGVGDLAHSRDRAQLAHLAHLADPTHVRTYVISVHIFPRSRTFLNHAPSPGYVRTHGSYVRTPMVDGRMHKLRPPCTAYVCTYLYVRTYLRACVRTYVHPRLHPETTAPGMPCVNWW